MADLDTFRNVIPYILKHFHVIAIWREFMGWCGDGQGGTNLPPPNHTHKNMLLHHAWVLVHGWLMWTPKRAESASGFVHLGHVCVDLESVNGVIVPEGCT